MDRLTLLPCPFCGGEAELRKQYNALEGGPKHYVRCSDGKCGARYVPGGFPVDEWNNRQSLSQEAVRDGALDAAAKICELFAPKIVETNSASELIASTAHQIREKILALKREPNAAAAEGPAHGLPCWPVDRPAPAVVELIAQLHDMAFALEKQGSEHWAMNCGYAAALLAKLGQGRYSAPFKMIVGKEEWVQIRFVSRAHIHDKPTEANPSPIRVILMHELERAQPAAMAYPVPGASDD